MSGPLEGICVLEAARVAPVAFCTMMLGDMGAEVIKVETPPDVRGSGSGTAISPDATSRQITAFSYANRNKKSIAVDLKAVEGQQVLVRLAKAADVLVEGFRPGVMKRLGADYDSLHAENPRLIYCSLSGFGQDGPYRDLPGHDLNYIAFGGALAMIGHAGQLPTIPLNIIGDYAAASLHGVIGILLALAARERIGSGQFVDIAYLDNVVALTAAVPGISQYFIDATLPQRGMTALGGAYPYYNVYETRDGKMLALGCIESHLWLNFCQAIGREDLVRFRFELEHAKKAPDAATVLAVEELRKLFMTRSRDEWFDLLRNSNVCVGKVNTWDEVLDDPQVRHRNMVVKVEDPEAGVVPQIGVGIKLSETPGSIRSLAPFLGQHTDDVLGQLGYSSGELRELREKGVTA